MKVEHFLKHGLYVLGLIAEDGPDEDFLRKFFCLNTEPTIQLHNDPAYKHPSLSISKEM